MRRIENLVFKGGGILGISYAGAVRTLEDRGVMKHIRRTAGTSVGSLVACLVSLGYTASEIKEVMEQTDFDGFLSSANPINIPKSYGIYSGEPMFSWIKELISEKTSSEDITFQEFKDSGYKDLRVFATDLTNSDIQEFSFQKTPETKVAESIRASMSIPMIFKAWQFSNKKPNDHIYVDGGVISNYPIHAFSNLEKTLGFNINAHIQDKNLRFDNISGYARNLFKAVLRGQDLDYLENEKKQSITVNIDSLGISSVDFDLSEEQMKSLYDEGLKVTAQYLDSHQTDSLFEKWFGKYV